MSLVLRSEVDVCVHFIVEGRRAGEVRMHVYVCEKEREEKVHLYMCTLV